MGGVDHVLTTRDTPQSSTLDARSLGVGIVIGMLSTLILVSLGFLLTTTYNKKNHHHTHTSGYSSSKFQSSSRRHLVRSVMGTERITIDDGDEPAPISFSSSLGHQQRRYDHQRRTGLYENNGMPTTTPFDQRQGTYDMQNMHHHPPSADGDDDALSVIDIAPIPQPPPPTAAKIETSPSTQFPSGYWSSSSNTPSPSTSTTLQTHTELLPSISTTAPAASRPVSSPPPQRRRSSISKTHLSPRRAVDGEQRGHAAMPSLGQSPPPPYANLTHVEDGTQ